MTLKFFPHAIILSRFENPLKLSTVNKRISVWKKFTAIVLVVYPVDMTEIGTNIANNLLQY